MWGCRKKNIWVQEEEAPNTPQVFLNLGPCSGPAYLLFVTFVLHTYNPPSFFPSATYAFYNCTTMISKSLGPMQLAQHFGYLPHPPFYFYTHQLILSKKNIKIYRNFKIKQKNVIFKMLNLKN